MMQYVYALDYSIYGIPYGKIEVAFGTHAVLLPGLTLLLFLCISFFFHVFLCLFPF